jgi:hypothetical protein
VNPDLLRSMAHETGGEAFIATDKSGPREQHAFHPRPPGKDEVRIPGGGDGGPLPVLAGARSVILVAFEAGCVRLVLVRRLP